MDGISKGCENGREGEGLVSYGCVVGVIDVGKRC